jgi:hypothetical protein
MLRRTALKPKRRYKSVELERFHGWVAEQGCLVCDWRDPETGTATVHHVTGYADKPGRFSRSDWLVVPLCPAHHQHDYGPLSVERVGHQAFFSIHGIDLREEAMRLAETWQRLAA